MQLPDRSNSSADPHSGHRKRPVARLAVIVGTCFLKLAQHLRILDADAVVASDAPTELETLTVAAEDRDRVYCIALGEKSTLQATMRKGTSGERESIAGLPVTSARHGLSRVRVVGGVLLRVLMLLGEVKNLFVNHIIPTVWHAHRGTTSPLQIDLYAGTAGGTASRGAIVFARALCDLVRQYTNADIELNVYLLGSESYRSPGFDRCAENSSASLVEWLDFARNHGNDSVQVILYVIELAPYGRDKALRESRLLEAVQAIKAQEISRSLDVDETNAMLSAEFGNVRTVRVGHFQTLPEERIATDIANKDLQTVDELLRTRADLGEIKRIDWDLAMERKSRESVNGILQRALNAQPEDILSSVKRPAFDVQASFTIRLSNGGSVTLAAADTELQAPLVSVQQTQRRVRLLRSCRLAIKLEEKRLHAEVAQVNDQLEVACRRLKAAVSAYQGSGWLTLFRSEQSKSARLTDDIQRVRTLLDQRNEERAKLDAAHAGLGRLTTLRDRLMSSLKSLSRDLRSFRSREDDELAPATVVVPTPVDSRWAWMMSHSAHGSIGKDNLQQFLAGSIAFVTAEGLAQIVGAPNSGYSAIVEAVESRRNMQWSPYFGGHQPRQRGRSWLVYPPVEPNTAKAVRQHHSDHEQIAFAVTADGSVNCLEIEIRSCESLPDALPPNYRKDFQTARNSARPGFYICDPDAAKRLGIVDESEPPPQFIDLQHPNS